MKKLIALIKKRSEIDQQIKKLKGVKKRPLENQRIRCTVKCYAYMNIKTAKITGIYNHCDFHKAHYPKESHVRIDSGPYIGETWLWRRVIEWEPL